MPTADKVRSIEEFAQPSDFAGLRRFLGMIGFYRRFIPRFADLADPLYGLMTRFTDNPRAFEMTDKAIASFTDIKQALAESVRLTHPDSTSDIYHLVCDASNVAVGAALHQSVKGENKPLAFFSKRLSKAQQSYSTFDRELLAAYLSVLHFRHIIEIRNVILHSDHKPLASAFTSPNSLKLSRQQRHLSVVSEFVSSIEYIRGSDNIVADALSRSVNSVTTDFLDLASLAHAQVSDNECLQWQEKLTAKPLGPDLQLYCECSAGAPRPFVVAAQRKPLFDQLHSLSHPGIKGSATLIGSRYFWPKMKAEIKEWVRGCLDCQRAKVGRHTKTAVVQPNFPSSDRFQTVHMDIVGPLLPSKPLGQSFTTDVRYVVTFIDRSTRWVEACPTSDITAQTVAYAFLSCWISRFGVPLHLITDRGTQFEAELFTHLSTLVGFHRLRTTSYHPQSNGMIERVHRTIKTALKARGDQWLSALPIVLLGVRCIPGESNFSPFTAVTGTTILAPNACFDTSSTRKQIDFINTLAKNMQSIDFSRLSRGVHHQTYSGYIPKSLKHATHVWVRIDRVRKPLEAPYQGPYPLVEATDKLATIELPTGRRDRISLDRVKPVHFASAKSNNSSTTGHSTAQSYPVSTSHPKPLPDKKKHVSFATNLAKVSYF